MMMKYSNNLSIGFFSRRGIGILCDCALSTNICLNIHHGSALAFQIIENFGQMPDRELHNSAASNAEGTRGWRAATWPLLEERGGHRENCGRASGDEQGASIEGIPTNGRRFTYYEESNTLGTISMGELYTKCGREQHQLKMASYCDNLGDQGNQVEKD